MSIWVYILSGVLPNVWTTGFYDPAGSWHADKDFSDPEQAAQRCHYLNGGDSDGEV